MLIVPLKYTKDKDGVEYHALQDSFDINDPFGLTILGGNVMQVTEPRPPSIRYYNFYSIAYNISGNGYFILEGESQRQFMPGQVAIITPGMKHYYGSLEDKFIESFILFTGPLADYLYEAGIIGNVLWKTGDKQLLDSIIQSYADPSLNIRIQAKMALLNLLMTLYKQNMNTSQDAYSLIPELINEMKSDVSRTWSVVKMSNFCHMSEPHFRRIFKAHTGCAPKEYFEKLKMNQAANMLIYSNKKIINIAAEIGFSDPYHFNRRFKKVTGMPPGAYRRLRAKKIT